MKIAKFKYIVFSDLHYGHVYNPALSIIENFFAFLKDYDKLLKDLDVVFIAGDIYDKLLSKHSTENRLIDNWFIWLVLYCEKRNIKIRVLEGTQSHDYHQANNVSNLIRQLRSNVDFKYIDTLHIEHMEEFNINILYIPDEYKHDATETYKDVLTLLKANGLKDVDIAIMHGQFKYQFPNIFLKTSHDEACYLDIVKHYISIGHIHTASVFDRILAQGSFDRIAQGEEEDKGAMLITIRNDKRSYMFLKNTRAKIFKTLNYVGLNIDTLLKKLDEDLKNLPHYSYIRIIVSPDNQIKNSVKKVNEKYGLYYFKIMSEDIKINIGKDITQNIEPTQQFHITRENIVEILEPEILKHSLTELELRIARHELTQILSAI